MGTPQIIFVTCLIVELLIVAEDHGKAIKQNVFLKIIDTAITVILLICGGFFN